MNLEPLLELIRRFEGCRLVPYLCPAGTWTCGWGSTGPGVIPGRAWSQAYADERMLADAERFTRGALAACPGLAADERALCAIADFAYNLGLGRLQASALRRRVNAGDWDGARAELTKWVYGGGRSLKGLVLRRAAEAALLPA